VQLLAAVENGFGKRTPLDEYRHTNRGGMGVINIKVNERNGNVVNVVVVDDKTELLLLTERGMIQRIQAGEIRETGRAAQGVRLMVLEEGDRLTTMAKIPHIEDVPVTAVASETDGSPPEPDDAPEGDDKPAPAGDEDVNV
jgi:DNA gyrase subunit A